MDADTCSRPTVNRIDGAPMFISPSSDPLFQVSKSGGVSLPIRASIAVTARRAIT